MIRYPSQGLPRTHYPAGDDEPGTSTRTLCLVAGSRGAGRRSAGSLRHRWFQTTRERSVVDCKNCQRLLARGEAR